MRPGGFGLPAAGEGNVTPPWQQLPRGRSGEKSLDPHGASPGGQGSRPPGFSAVETLEKPDNAFSIRLRRDDDKSFGVVTPISLTSAGQETDKNGTGIDRLASATRHRRSRRHRTEPCCPYLPTLSPATTPITTFPLATALATPVRCFSLSSRAAPWLPPLARHPVHQGHDSARTRSPRRHRRRSYQRQPSGLQRRYPRPPTRTLLRRHRHPRPERPRLLPCSRRQPHRPPAHRGQCRHPCPAPATYSQPRPIPGGANCTFPTQLVSQLAFSRNLPLTKSVRRFRPVGCDFPAIQL